MKIRFQVFRYDPVIRRGAWNIVHRQFLDMEKVAKYCVSNPAYWALVENGEDPGDTPESIDFWREDLRTGLVSIARNLPVPLLNPNLHLWDVYPSAPKEGYGARHTITLRDDVPQKEACHALMDTPGDKILSLGCGVGKTVCALYSAAEGERLPVLVIVHTEDLLKQWRLRIQEHWGLAAEEIGHVQQNVCKWKGKPIVVALLHTLIGRQFSPEFYDYFRLVITDECHRIGAAQWSRVAPMFPCERWGLSATMLRKDGMEKLIHAHLGKVAFEYRQKDLIPKTLFVDTGLEPDLSGIRIRYGQPNLPQVYTRMGRLTERNRLIMRWVNRASDDGRHVLVLGERIEQLEEMRAMSTAASHGLFIGKANKSKGKEKAPRVSKEDRERVRDAELQKQVVFATQHLAKEGLDRPDLDTLINMFPFGDAGRLEQSWGRILRRHPTKKKPVVLVFYEKKLTMFRKHVRKMQDTCRRLGYPWKEVSIHEERVKKP